MQSKQLSMSIGKSSDKTADSNIARSSSTSEYAIKVRKPYTISKQRERWTDEEHDKFLEALRLHGRAWRKIEEHIGTKTAVQIRSHAQKFFAKVARETSGGNSDGTNAIGIPPPRPKKKPSHPYPRKLENMLVTPNIEVEAQENMSPTSVISTDAFNYSVSSPVSCVNQSELFKTALSEDGCQSGTTSVEDESKPIFLNKSDVDVDVITGDTTAGKEGSSSLKLFGKTLVVAEPCKAGRPTEETNNQLCFWPNNAAPMFCLVPIWGLYCNSELHIPQAQMAMSSEGESSSCAEDSGNNSNVELGIESRSMKIDIGSETCKFRQSETSAFRSLKARPKMAEPKGFVPYKRCLLAEREVSQKIVNDIGGENEVRLYL